MKPNIIGAVLTTILGLSFRDVFCYYSLGILTRDVVKAKPKRRSSRCIKSHVLSMKLLSPSGMLELAMCTCCSSQKKLNSFQHFISLSLYMLLENLNNDAKLFGMYFYSCLICIEYMIPTQFYICHEYSYFRSSASRLSRLFRPALTSPDNRGSTVAQSFIFFRMVLVHLIY